MRLSKKTVIIFVVAFLISLVFLGTRLLTVNIIDDRLWAEQSALIYTSDPSTYHTLDAYGHPGGPIIEAAIVLHHIFGLEYYNAVMLFLFLFSSFLIATIAVISYKLRSHLLWTITVIGTLALNKLHKESTPPSLLASLLFVLLALLLLFMWERRSQIKNWQLLLWAAVLGLLVAIRVELGTVVAIISLPFFIWLAGWKRSLGMVAMTVISFVLFDPFVWFDSTKHVYTLIWNMTHHYTEYFVHKMTFWTVFESSLLMGVSMVVAVVFMVSKKKLLSPFPKGFIVWLFSITLLLYGIFLTASHQVPRYLQPLTLIWEVLLPLYIFTLIAKMQFSFVHTDEQQQKTRSILSLGVIIALLLSNISSLLIVYHNFFGILTSLF